MTLSYLRVVKMAAGLVLIVVGVGLFVIITAEVNAAQSLGPAMDLGVSRIFTYWPVLLVLDVIFLSLVLGGVKLAGFRGTVFGWIVVVTGIGVLCLGLWHQVTGPPEDYDSDRSNPNEYPAPPAMHAIVYIWAGVTLLLGLLLVALTNWRNENS